MVARNRRRSTRFTRSPTRSRRRAAPAGRAPARRTTRRATPQTIRIVIEQPQPQAAQIPFLPEQVGAVQALTTPRRARF